MDSASPLIAFLAQLGGVLVDALVFCVELAQEGGVEGVHVGMEVAGPVVVEPYFLGGRFGVGVVHEESLRQNLEIVVGSPQLADKLNFVFPVAVKPFVVVRGNRELELLLFLR